MKISELLESKEPRNSIEAFVKPYIEELVGKPAGTSVDIPHTVKGAALIDVRAAITLWMGRLITKSRKGMYSMSYVQKSNHFTITLKKDA